MKYSSEIFERLMLAVDDFREEVQDILEDAEDYADEKVEDTADVPKPSFKVGQEVCIKEDLELGKFYDNCLFVPPMKKYLGKTAVITAEDLEGDFSLDIDGGCFIWSPEMLEEVHEEEAQEPTYKNFKPGTKAVVLEDDDDIFKPGTIVTVMEDSFTPYCKDANGRVHAMYDHELLVLADQDV